MFKYQYYIVIKNNIIRNEKIGDIIKGQKAYSAPFHPTDMSTTYVLNGYAIGRNQLLDLIGKGYIKRISKKEACERLIRRLR